MTPPIGPVNRWIERRARLAIAALCVLPLAAFSCGRKRLPYRLAGCYALFDQRGRPASDSLYWAPARMRLDTGPATRLPGHPGLPTWVVSKLGPQPDAYRHGILYWTPESPSYDSIRVVLSSGFSGTELTLSASGRDTLSGRATEFWDFGPPFKTDGGRVTTVRVACDSADAR